MVTSSAAFDFARKLCDEFDRRKKDLFHNCSLKQTVFQFFNFGMHLMLVWVFSIILIAWLLPGGKRNEPAQRGETKNSKE